MRLPIEQYQIILRYVAELVLQMPHHCCFFFSQRVYRCRSYLTQEKVMVQFLAMTQSIYS